MNNFAPVRQSRKEEALLVKRLSLLMRSGTSVPSALRALAGEGRGRRSIALRACADEAEAGAPLHASFARFPHLFSPLSREVVRVGEESGSLADNLGYLSKELEKQARLRGKLLGSLVYPVLLAVLTILIAGGLVLFIFPKVLPLFSSLGADLPLPTKLMLGISAYLTNWGWATLIAAVASVAGLLVSFRRSVRMRAWRARLALRVPVLASLLQSYRLSSFARSLGLLLSSHLSLPEALRGAGQATGHLLFEEALMRTAHAIEEGGSLCDALKHEPLFPGLAVDLLSAGEASGSLAESAFHLAEYYEHEFEEATRRLTVLVEPTLMILMGLVVGFVAISMILPIYRITDHLHAK